MLVGEGRMGFQADAGRPTNFVIGTMVSVLLIVQGIVSVRKQLSSGNDFPIYFQAAREMLSGQFHYQVGTGLHGYVYLPFFAIILAPLTLLPLRTAAIVWYIINLLAWGVSIVIVSGIQRRVFPRANRYVPIITALVLTGQFFLFNLDLGQTNLLILMMTLLALERALSNREDHAGFLIALAAAIKPFAAILFIPLLLRFRRRVSTGFVAGLLFSVLLLPFSLLGPGSTWRLLSEWHAKIIVPQQTGSLQGSKVIDQSPEALLHRLTTHSPAFDDHKINILHLSPREFLALGRILQLALLGSLLLGWLAGRRGDDPAGLIIDAAAAYCGMVLVFGFSLRAQFVVLFLPWVLLMILVFSRDAQEPFSSWRVKATLLTAALLIFAANPGLVGRTASNWLLAYSAITVGVLIMTGVLIWMQLRRKRLIPLAGRAANPGSASQS